jgi:cellobiose phosphorylase
MRFLKFEEKAKQYQDWYGEIASIFNIQAWDGDWFRSYYDAEGNPLGSRINTAGQIFAYSQAWPVLAGFANHEKARTALDSLYKKLNTKHGIKLSAPGFDHYNPEVGGITTYPPGAKENGGIILHVNPWVIIAETLLGRGDRAYEYYSQINPAAKNDLLDVYEVEPYVYAQNILGDEHPKFGMGRNSWLSGTASWMYQAGTQYILGIKPEYNGLRIDPCIPSGWDSYKVKRYFRGTWYEIQVENPDHVNRGTGDVYLDGRLLSGNLLPVLRDGNTHQVRVILSGVSK